jgi:hypothetical protein
MNTDVEVTVGYLIHYSNLPSVSTINRQKTQEWFPVIAIIQVGI